MSIVAAMAMRLHVCRRMINYSFLTIAGSICVTDSSLRLLLGLLFWLFWLTRLLALFVGLLASVVAFVAT